MGAFAAREGFEVLAFGEIVDDWGDHRPGAQAAREYGVVAPLSGAGLSKADVRRYAAEHGLEVAHKPASACLASRIPVGTEVTPERLARVEAHAASPVNSTSTGTRSRAADKPDASSNAISALSPHSHTAQPDISAKSSPIACGKVKAKRPPSP